MIRRTLYEAVMVALITLALSAAAYLIRPHALPLWPSKTRLAEPEGNSPGYREISFDRAVALFKKHAALFADARPRHAFIEGHIKGAVHLDPYLFETWSQTLTAETPLDQTIVTYCDGATCSLSEELAEKLTWLGYEKVFYLKDGWRQWQQAGLPTSQGD